MLPGVFKAIKILDRRCGPPTAEGASSGPGSLSSGPSVTSVERELAGLHAFQTHARDHPPLIQINKTWLCRIADGDDIQPLVNALLEG